MSEYVVEMRDIVKTFGEVQAVKNGEFTLKKGEIHSLIGENGAGKSTMMKLLYGMYPIDSGEIIVKGEKMTALDPKIAINHGIGMVHQEFMLVNELTVPFGGGGDHEAGPDGLLCQSLRAGTGI